MLSVIIPTRNRAALLDEALLSFRSQVLPADRFEVLVIDNGSTDGTKQIVEEHQRSAGNIRYFHESVPGLHVGRHRGLREASANILVYADDDIKATPTWLAAIDENFADPEVAMVGGNNFPNFTNSMPAWLARLWKQRSMGGHAIPSLSVLVLPEGRYPFDPYLVWGCNFSIRKQVLLAAGGFHPDAMPPDLIRFRGDGETCISRFVKDRKLRCMFDSRVSVHHAVPPERMTWEYFCQRSYNQGISDSYSCLRSAQQVDGRRPSWIARLMAASKTGIRGGLAAMRILAPYDIELRKLQLAMRESYRGGFAYHQRIYQDDPEVRTWVHRRDYFALECDEGIDR